MTSPIDSLLPETTPAHTMSDADLARAEAEAALHADCRRRAARVLASCAVDADEFRALAEMIGLERGDIAAARDNKPHRRARPNSPRRQVAPGANAPHSSGRARRTRVA